MTNRLSTARENRQARLPDVPRRLDQFVKITDNHRPYTMTRLEDRCLKKEISNADRFLNAFCRIERFLERSTRGRSGGFVAMAARVSSRNSAVRRFLNDLREYADLRNAIVHDRRNGQIIADPRAFVVEEIEWVADQITRPPTVDSLKRKVVQISRSDSIEFAVQLMKQHDFSKLPVRDRGRISALLTSDTITRWFADSVSKGGVILSDTLVGDVIKHKGKFKNYALVRRKATLIDLLETFESMARKGQRLDAALITANGKPTEQVIGIVTRSDLASVYTRTKIARE